MPPVALMQQWLFPSRAKAVLSKRCQLAVQNRKPQRGGYLDGQLLIAMPAMGDPRFARSVIYICAHSEDGAMGLIINQRAPISASPSFWSNFIVPPEAR